VAPLGTSPFFVRISVDLPTKSLYLGEPGVWHPAGFAYGYLALFRKWPLGYPVATQTRARERTIPASVMMPAVAAAPADTLTSAWKPFSL
jgi:hypothetical protein